MVGVTVAVGVNDGVGLHVGTAGGADVVAVGVVAPTGHWVVGDAGDVVATRVTAAGVVGVAVAVAVGVDPF